MQTASDAGAGRDIPILFEDDDVVVIDKPSGLLVHGDGALEADTVATWHLVRIPEAVLVGEPITKSDGTIIEKPGIVHRLDQDTSGVLILAKNQEAFLHLKEQFKERLAKKEYRAFVYGLLVDGEGVIDRPIGRSAKDFRLRSAQRGARGTLRPAVTRWRKIKASHDHTYVAVFPETGRTHQIRTHFKSVSHPIVCDRLYAPKLPCALGFSRVALHAHVLDIELPSKERRSFTAPLPPDFLAAERML